MQRVMLKKSGCDSQEQLSEQILPVCTKRYPEIRRFPVSVQKLLAMELEKVEERMEKGKEIYAFEDESVRCYCMCVAY